MNCKFRKILSIGFTFGVTFFPYFLMGQSGFFFNTDQYPPSLRWKKIATPHYDLIFPEALSGDALRIANLLEDAYSPLHASFEIPSPRIAIVLGNQGVRPNGYVSLAPRRSEWFHQRSQGWWTGTTDWYTLLAVHEGRHGVQFDKANSGFTKLMGLCFGDIGILGFSMFSIPYWWWEGDAVYTETRLTPSGRGRLPEFEMGLKALLETRPIFSYSKMYLGSYKDWTPNVYQLGYVLVDFIHRHYGESCLDRVIHRTSEWSFWPFSFARAIKKETGKSLDVLYREALSELKTKKTTFPIQIQEIASLPSSSSVWTEYLFPQYTEDGVLVAQKYGLDTPWSLVRISPSGKEEKLCTFYPTEPGATRTSVRAGKIVWDEEVPDIRWGKRAYSTIVVMDLQTGSKQRLTHRTRYFNPEFSPDGSRIAVIEFSERAECNLVILDGKTGNPIHSFSAPENAFLQSPSWSPNGKNVICVAQSETGKSLYQLDIENGIFHKIRDFGHENIMNPVFWKKYILYASPKLGITNVCAWDTLLHKPYLVTRVSYGAFSPTISPDSTRLLFSNYTPQGTRIGEMVLDSTQWIFLDTLSISPTQPMGVSYSWRKNDSLVYYPIANYSKWGSLWNLHSWAFLPLLPEYTVMLFSTNLLNTTWIEPVLFFNSNERTSAVQLNVLHAEWFPVLRGGISAGSRCAMYLHSKKEYEIDTWREKSLSLGISLPLNISRGAHATFLNFDTKGSYTEIQGKTHFEPEAQGNGDLMVMQFNTEILHYTSYAPRDMTPAWAQRVCFSYSSTPLKTTYRGTQSAFRADFRFPGFFRHHRFGLQLAWEWQNPINYRFESMFPFSKGYHAILYDHMKKAGIEYLFPLAYPDWSLGHWIYVNRLKTALFYDYTEGRIPPTRRLYRAFGIELRTDIHFFTLPVPLDLGIRYVYCVEKKKAHFEPAWGSAF